VCLVPPSCTVPPMGTEWVVVIIVAVVLFGGSQIPKLARSLGQAQKEFKKGINEGASDDEKADEPKHLN
jgi:sec-independent protein translocase protein TatA